MVAIAAAVNAMAKTLSMNWSLKKPPCFGLDMIGASKDLIWKMSEFFSAILESISPLICEEREKEFFGWEPTLQQNLYLKERLKKSYLRERWSQNVFFKRWSQDLSTWYYY